MNDSAPSASSRRRRRTRTVALLSAGVATLLVTATACGSDD
ncbi:iron-siderophore ABC transporter substrate-binding protein, partial [Streptomyces sp. SID11233]|nr:iron-siderophore ABC transporter substrate-binding protein [Streptomyces sp. SID11233]